MALILFEVNFVLNRLLHYELFQLELSNQGVMGANMEYCSPESRRNDYFQVKLLMLSF